MNIIIPLVLMLSCFCTYQKSILGDTNRISADIPNSRPTTQQAAGTENGSVLPGLVSGSATQLFLTTTNGIFPGQHRTIPVIKLLQKQVITYSTNSKNCRNSIQLQDQPGKIPGFLRSLCHISQTDYLLLLVLTVFFQNL